VTSHSILQHLNAECCLRAESAGAELVSKEELFRRSDVLTAFDPEQAHEGAGRGGRTGAQETVCETCEHPARSHRRRTGRWLSA
jgi:hypothetical protein